MITSFSTEFYYYLLFTNCTAIAALLIAFKLIHGGNND
jgi:hypothetical protein